VDANQDHNTIGSLMQFDLILSNLHNWFCKVLYLCFAWVWSKTYLWKWHYNTELYP